jgi:hypothetical protein
MRRWAVAWALVAWLAAGVGDAAAEETMSDERETEAVVDAVYRALLAEAVPDPTEVVCLVVRRAVDGKEQLGDPSAEHLARLQKENPNVRAGGACKRGRDQPAVEAATGKKAVVLDVGPVQWSGARGARTGGGFSRGGWTTVEWEYELTKRDGAWVVVKATATAIT